MYRVNCKYLKSLDNMIPCKNLSDGFSYRRDADDCMTKMVINQLSMLNKPDDKLTPRTDIYMPMFNFKYEGIVYDAALLLWDGKNGIALHPAILYQIEWCNDSLCDEWNKKLKEIYGESVTVWVKSELVDDELADSEDIAEVEKFFFEGAICGQSDDYYDTPEEAYEAAVDYLESLN